MPIPSSMWCEGCVKDQADTPYTLWRTLTDEHQAQLLSFAHTDPLIVENTSDPERFASAEKLQHWLAGDRLIFALTPQENPSELAGLFWFSHEPFPLETADETAQNSTWTMAIRLYETARGKRLSLPFMQTAFEYFWREHPGENVWLSTNQGNEVSQKIYTQFGFEKVAHQDGKVFYVRSV